MCRSRYLCCTCEVNIDLVYLLVCYWGIWYKALFDKFDISKMQSAVRSMIEATIETAYTPASTRLRRKSVKPPPAPPRWRTLLTVIYSKLRTKRSWVAVMFVLGTVDMALNLVNFIQTSSPDLSYGLVIGPPTRDLWISMCVFTVFGTLLYIPETINTFSALYRLAGYM